MFPVAIWAHPTRLISLRFSWSVSVRFAPSVWTWGPGGKAPSVCSSSSSSPSSSCAITPLHSVYRCDQLVLAHVLRVDELVLEVVPVGALVPSVLLRVLDVVDGELLPVHEDLSCLCLYAVSERLVGLLGVRDAPYEELPQFLREDGQ